MGQNQSVEYFAVASEQKPSTAEKKPSTIVHKKEPVVPTFIELMQQKASEAQAKNNAAIEAMLDVELHLETYNCHFRGNLEENDYYDG
jgi:hypothetical protein